jgi:predicted RNA-binding protein with PUA-like domain
MTPAKKSATKQSDAKKTAAKNAAGKKTAMKKSAAAADTSATRRWVFLADPQDYGWNELLADGGTRWDGLRNAQAQRHLRSCAAGDIVVLYHTAPDKALVGTARVSEPAGDEADGAPRIEPVIALARPLPLAEIRADSVLAGASFVRMPRVAVHPLDPSAWDRIMKLTGTDPGAAGDVDPAVAGGP